MKGLLSAQKMIIVTSGIAKQNLKTKIKALSSFFIKRANKNKSLIYK